MRRSARKSKIFGWLILIFIILSIAGCIAWTVICNVLEICNKSFWYINFEGIVSISVEIMTGCFIAYLIFCVGETNENDRRKKEMMHQLLDRIESYFTNDISSLTMDSDLEIFWSKTLRVKKMTRHLLENLNLLNATKLSEDKITNISIKCIDYFDYLEGNLYPNAKLSESIITCERNLREEVIIAISRCSCSLYLQ